MTKDKCLRNIIFPLTSVAQTLQELTCLPHCTPQIGMFQCGEYLQLFLSVVGGVQLNSLDVCIGFNSHTYIFRHCQTKKHKGFLCPRPTKSFSTSTDSHWWQTTSCTWAKSKQAMKFSITKKAFHSYFITAVWTHHLQNFATGELKLQIKVRCVAMYKIRFKLFFGWTIFNIVRAYYLILRFLYTGFYIK